MSQYYHYGTQNLPRDPDKRRREMKRRRNAAKAQQTKSGVEESGGLLGRAARAIKGRRKKIEKHAK